MKSKGKERGMSNALQGLLQCSPFHCEADIGCSASLPSVAEIEIQNACIC